MGLPVSVAGTWLRLRELIAAGQRDSLSRPPSAVRRSPLTAIGAAYRAAEDLRLVINVAQLAKKQPRVACGGRSPEEN